MKKKDKKRLKKSVKKALKKLIALHESMDCEIEFSSSKYELQVQIIPAPEEAPKELKFDPNSPTPCNSSSFSKIIEDRTETEKNDEILTSYANDFMDKCVNNPDALSKDQMALYASIRKEFNKIQPCVLTNIEKNNGGKSKLNYTEVSIPTEETTKHSFILPKSFPENFPEVYNDWKNGTFKAADAPEVFGFSTMTFYNKAHQYEALMGKEGKPFGRVRALNNRIPLPENFPEIYNKWRNGTFSPSDSPKVFGFTRRTFYKKVQEYEEMMMRGNVVDESNLRNNQILFPENFPEVYTKWINKEITSLEAMKRLGVTRAIFYDRVHRYEKIQEQEQRTSTDSL